MILSIITINLNNKTGLQKTIDSIIHQTYKNFEWIIIDGGSTDGSKELIQQYKEHLTYWISEKDNGIYEAMNKGINVAKGKYLNFLNSGDCFSSNDILSELALYNYDYDIIYGDAIYTYNDQRQELKTFNNQLSLSYFVSGKVINHQASFIKKELFKNCPYNENFKIVSDWEFWIKQSILNRSFYHINKTIINFDYTGITSKPSLLQEKEKEIVLNNLPWAIKKDLKELFYLRKTINEGHLKVINEYFNKGIIFQKIINFTIHVLDWVYLLFYKNNK